MGYVKQGDTSQATGAHFTQPGHSLSDMKFTVIEQVKKNNEMYRKLREKYFIKEFDTNNKGINKKT